MNRSPTSEPFEVAAGDAVWQRVAVVGTSGVGKSTFAAALAATLQAPHIELDALHWGPDWTPRPAELFAADTEAAVAAERWVSDGNYSQVRPLVWPRATALVWLDYSFAVNFSRVLRRTLRRVASGETLYAGNRESLGTAFLSRDSILLWMMTTHGRRRREYPRLIEAPEHRHLHVERVRRPGQAKALLTRIGEAAKSSSRPGGAETASTAPDAPPRNAASPSQ